MWMPWPALDGRDLAHLVGQLFGVRRAERHERGKSVVPSIRMAAPHSKSAAMRSGIRAFSWRKLVRWAAS